MLTIDEIRETLQRELPYLREHYDVKMLGLFGSYVRGEQKRSQRQYLVDMLEAMTHAERFISDTTLEE